MSEIAPVTPEGLAAGREKRRARLFERHCDGARLTASERNEIADLLAASEIAAQANQLRLEHGSAVKVNRRSGLAHTFQYYADQLGLGLRTVKRWHSEGVKAADVCPLDDLAKFPDWWSRVHAGRALDCNVAAAIERVLHPLPEKSIAVGAEAQVKDADQSTNAESGGEAPPAPAAARPGIMLVDTAALTIEQNLVALKTIHAANVELLERAFRSGTQIEVDSRQRNVERSARMLIEAQRALNEHLKQSGDLISREEIKRELIRLHTAMALSLVGQFVQIGVARERAIVMADAWFGHLRQSRFAATTAPDLLPATASAA